MASATEAQLLARCRRGEPEAWDELFTLHYAAVGRFVYQLGHDFTSEDVEEISQDAFLAVIKHIESFHGESQFQTWVFRIAANKARDFRERRQAAKRGGGQVAVSLNAEDPETSLTIDPPSNAPGPDQVLQGAELAGTVHRALEELGEPCREVVELRYFGDLSYEEISAALTLNVKTVSSRLSKCLDRLEEIMKRILSGENSALFPSNL
jgi:RNA polymerase sigma-70 factor (ECF subfamily)